MKILISYTSYCLSHGAMPRGRGSWMFVFGKADYDFVEEAVACPLSMGANGMPTFAEAKRWAIGEAKRRGVTIVGVCS